MVELGLCTRREADACIEQGLVKVDGQTVTALGSRVEPQQRVELMGRPDAQREAAVTLLLHKPAGAEPLALLGPDSQLPGDISGLSWLPRHRQHLQGFGAIVDHAHGLVALTQDRKLAQRLADCQLEFLINVDAAPAAGDLQQRQKGLRPGGKPLRDLKVSRQSDRPSAAPGARGARRALAGRYLRRPGSQPSGAALHPHRPAGHWSVDRRAVALCAGLRAFLRA
ncbi:hypothetical protein JOS77_07950 [Chromobacterium haemolyticum]|nr:hypothetical protein JOS77_07950 [Chromobacterium haemolyticum]